MTSGNIILGGLAGEVGRRAAQDLVLLLQLFGSLTQLTILDREVTAW